MMTYTNRNGYQIPNLTLPPQEKHPLGKYGRMRLAFLKAHRRETYMTLLVEAKLSEHLWEIEQTAKEQIRQTVERMAAEQGVNEQMKRENPILWTQAMNNLQASAEEIVLYELIGS